MQTAPSRRKTETTEIGKEKEKEKERAKAKAKARVKVEKPRNLQETKRPDRPPTETSTGARKELGSPR